MLKQKSGSLRNQIKARARVQSCREQRGCSYWHPSRQALSLRRALFTCTPPQLSSGCQPGNGRHSEPPLRPARKMTSQTCLRLAQHLVPMLLDRSPRVGQRLTERESPAFHGRGDVPTQSVPSKLMCAQSPTRASRASNAFKILLIKIK